MSATDLRDIEAFLYREARLLDEMKLTEWLSLYADDGLYWIPIDETQDAADHPALVYDDKARREERVYHLQNLPFPAQSPRSRTVHVVSNVESGPEDELSGVIVARSVQVVYEMRTGDFSQIGLGKVRPLAAIVTHELRRGEDGGLRIQKKTILLIDRDMPQSNLTFII